MKKLIVLPVLLLLIFPVFTGAQEKKAEEKKQTYKLSSEMLDNQGKELDKQISSLNKKLTDIVTKYDLLNTPGIRIVPYQTTYKLGKDYIEIEKHLVLKDLIYNRTITGIKTKKIRVYTSGKNVTKVVSEIYEKSNETGQVNIVRIEDPSPLSEGTDDILFTHVYKGKTLLRDRKLGEIKNTTAYPVRNDLKRDFLIPHLTYFSDKLQFIAEAYYKSVKDTDSNLAEFLKKSTQY